MLFVCANFGNRRVRSRGRRRGFTLIEAAMATVIIGFAFTAMLSLLAAGTVSNKEGTELTTAINLVGNIHEAAVRVDYANILSLRGSHNPPVNGHLQSMSGMTGWQQVVSVQYVDHNCLTLAVPDTQVEPTARITVVITRQGKFVYQTSWIATASQ
jgi:type II secretory pathway pseudopilin PulG